MFLIRHCLKHFQLMLQTIFWRNFRFSSSGSWIMNIILLLFSDKFVVTFDLKCQFSPKNSILSIEINSVNKWLLFWSSWMWNYGNKSTKRHLQVVRCFPQLLLNISISFPETNNTTMKVFLCWILFMATKLRHLRNLLDCSPPQLL